MSFKTFEQELFFYVLLFVSQLDFLQVFLNWKVKNYAVLFVIL